jgi:hypothetical protein
MIDNAPVRLFLSYSSLTRFIPVRFRIGPGCFLKNGTNQHIALWIYPDADDYTKMEEKVFGNRSVFDGIMLPWSFREERATSATMAGRVVNVRKEKQAVAIGVYGYGWIRWADAGFWMLVRPVRKMLDFDVLR